ncbi:hypothetical protein H2O64_23625 [Kordia sp. YSTF-M3]|uniref:Natural product n=1 Tax=Kordia aestuariivivens TaxID=2759037 RepID=A0ABR7QGH4_9FLAO|nr:hypothetical protein [Kordia aestuariivivens]MBC8757679.1 hypothetical protein [Kordia aestuariivivens]
MKKRNIKSLTLNKNSISQLQNMIGGRLQGNGDGPTMSGCSCDSCNPDCDTQNASTLGCTE